MSLNCKLEKSILKGSNCAYKLQSVKQIYLANVDDVTAIERTKPEAMSGTTDCGVEASTITLASGAKWALIQVAKNSASFTDTLNVVDNGGKFRTHTLSFSIEGAYDAQQSCNMDELSLGRFIAVAELADGNRILLGDILTPMEATAVSNTGAASATEFSGIAVEMSAECVVSAAPLSAAAIAAIDANIYDVTKE